MDLKRKVTDLTLKHILLIIVFIAMMILCLLKINDIIYFIGVLIGVTKPLMIGLMIAFILNIAMTFFEKHLPISNPKTKRLISGIAAILLFFLVIFMIINMILPAIAENISTLIKNMPDIVDQMQHYAKTYLKDFYVFEDVMKKVGELEKMLSHISLEQVTSLLPHIASTVGTISTTLMDIFLGFVFAVYMLFSKDMLLRNMNTLSKAAFSEKIYLKLKDVVHLIAVSFENFFTGQITESFIIGILCYIGCKILGIPYASIAAVLIGATNIIPYFGPLIGLVLSMIVIIFVSPMKALIFMVFELLLQQFESNLIYPRVVGNSVGLSPIWVLTAVTIGGGLFGITGMFLGLPVFSIIYELIKQWTIKKTKEKEIIET